MRPTRARSTRSWQSVRRGRSEDRFRDSPAWTRASDQVARWDYLSRPKVDLDYLLVHEMDEETRHRILDALKERRQPTTHDEDQGDDADESDEERGGSGGS